MHLETHGQALAADEPDHEHERPPGTASVHTRALVTWIAIYPLATLGLAALGAVVPDWPTPARTLALTAVVVPVTVYLTVPGLLRLLLALGRRQTPRATKQRKDEPAPIHPND